MALEQVAVFNFRTESIFLKNFPAVIGITPIAAGDFSKTNPNTDILLDNQLTRQLGGDFYHKVYPLHGDIINFGDNIGNHCYCDAIVSYLPKFKPEVLLCPTGDCPIVTLEAENQKLIAVIHSGWRGTELRIVPKTIRLIQQETGIGPEKISVGIFPGICSQCYEVGEDVAEKFPRSVHNSHLNLKDVILKQLYASGIELRKIKQLTLCSFHSRDRLDQPILFSYRRDKTTARNVVFITRNPF
jgi:copper oxidase (laccase) domain-containing protein